VIIINNNNGMIFLDGAEGKSIGLGEGSNDVRSADYSEFIKSQDFNKFVKDGIIEIPDTKRVKDASGQSKEVPSSYKDLTPAKAKKIIEKTNNVEILDNWLNSESKEELRLAIIKRKEELEKPTGNSKKMKGIW